MCFCRENGVDLRNGLRLLYASVLLAVCEDFGRIPKFPKSITDITESKEWSLCGLGCSRPFLHIIAFIDEALLFIQNPCNFICINGRLFAEPLI